jgi:hypothetical protein
MRVRVARHTDDLEAIVALSRDRLGLPEIGRFADHDGYDGVFDLGLARTHDGRSGVVTDAVGAADLDVDEARTGLAG